MPITRKPKPSTASPQGVDVDALINKGGSVAGRDAKAEQKEGAASPVVLRVPNHLLARIDQALASRLLRTPRHTWLLEAVLEKIEREEG